MSIETSVLDEIIIGRVEPHIYAFTTNTIPNCLKVGDTYRPVAARLNEWRAHYPNLQKQFEKSALIGESYFRDHSVHHYLEYKKRRLRLGKADFRAGTFYSKEFFKDATVADVEEACRDIEEDYRNGTHQYRYYNSVDRRSEEFTFVRNQHFDLRPNQKDTVEKFKKAVADGRTNLLMYAVMRFGKSFTAMCCAVEMDANLVVVTSAKADVMPEWKRTVESHVKFVDYDFIYSYDLLKDENAISKKLASGRKVVVFLTLQDLQGGEIKAKHKELFTKRIDLLLIDETHFGARADKYGEVLKSHGQEKDVDEKLSQEELLTLENYNETINKELSSKIRIHLSGTPYKILMGSEFKEEDRIAFYQFTDIVKDQEAWDREHGLDDDYEEWNNPYFGFPQMIRFAFNPNESSRKRLEELRKGGVTYAFSALFKPKSVTKTDDGKHKKFVYEPEVLDLLQVIDGSKDDDELLGFLDYEKIKQGNMCRHIVVVLPYCAACDALEALINDNRDKFKNLKEYEIINISGVDDRRIYKTPDIIKHKIKECESKNKKTVTLTVNRMLTGSTVPEWDTMLYLKDTASPQEYDQAIFRLQNQYVKTFEDDSGDTVKKNMKPQTLLVDFDPNRMFLMQEKKAQIYNVNTDEAGNSKLGERLREELEISPIVCLNKDKIVKATATDILEAVSNYKNDKGIKEEALDTPVDLDILKYDIVKSVIERENEIGSKSGLSVPAHKGQDDDEGDEFDVPEAEGNGDSPDISSHQSGDNVPDDKREQLSLTKKIQSYYTKILLFAFITDDRVASVTDIINIIDSEDNKRIAKSLGLDKKVLKIFNAHNKWVLRQLDYKIQDLSNLSHDENLEPIKKADIAVRKFGKLGDAIVITPPHICDDMVKLLPDEFIRSVADKNGRILDIAGTSGEFAAAIYKRASSLGVDKKSIANLIYTIPKSAVCYELTRKLYSMLGLNVDNIATKFVATDLLDVKKGNDLDYEKIKKHIFQNKKFSEISLSDNITEGDEKMTFDAIVGNPPYQVMDGGHGSSSAAIYDEFVFIGKKCNPKYLSIVIPSRWFSGGKGLDKFRTEMINDKHVRVLHDFMKSGDCFPSVQIEGGICYFLWDGENEGKCLVVSHTDQGEPSTKERYLKEDDEDIFIRNAEVASILQKIKPKTTTSFGDKVLPRNPFGLTGKEKDLTDGAFVGGYGVFGRFNGKRQTKYLKSDFVIKKNKDIVDKYKVFVSKADGAAGQIGNPVPAKIIGKAEMGTPKTVCTETFLAIGPFESEDIAKNVVKYMSTKFFRFCVGIRKNKNMTRETYNSVPMQDFTENSEINWSKSLSEVDKAACEKYGCDKINEIDAQLYDMYDLSSEEVQFIESMIKPME